MTCSDYNFIKEGSECVPAGPEPIPANVCREPHDTYMGSSGYRKIPGNTCQGGKKKDEPRSKPCKNGKSH